MSRNGKFTFTNNDASNGLSASPLRSDNPLAGKTIKTRQEFLNEIALRYSHEKLPEGLTPAKRTKALQKVLNKKTTRHRFVFSIWPRPPAIVDAHKMDPKPYEYITPENSLPGKMAPGDAQLWGSTLFDFYHVRRLPEVPNLRSISTGSKLARWARAHGEAEGPAKQYIEWADEEKDPELVPVCDIRTLIADQESCARSIGDRKEIHDAERKKWAHPSWPPKSVFDRIAYPPPWPSEPFSQQEFQRIPQLQQYVPQSRLPKKLIIHDPWNLLKAKRNKETKMPWVDKILSSPESTYTYKLKLSEKYTERRRADVEEVVKAHLRAKEILKAFLANPHSSNKERPPGFESFQVLQPGPTKPMLYVILPSPPPLAAANEAHLYLSPTQPIGEGNHSFVYHAEWELPRSSLLGEKLCMECVQEDVNAILKEEVASGKGQAKWDELSGNIVLKRKQKPPRVMTTSLDGLEDWSVELEEGDNSEYMEYEGPFHVIQSRVKYQNLERGGYCEHLAMENDSLHPLTTKVRVAAKLSIQHDNHLQREAENYQRFPKYFFEHWSGYNVIPPMHDPTPVGPLVPQFYGFYVPEKSKAEEGMDVDDPEQRPPAYLSPVLLLEHCGKPIDTDNLSIDDKQECVALAVRFHDAEWLHGSFAQRNILMQPGPLSEYPLQRWKNSELRGGYGVNWSFRMIDFGRSMYGRDEGGHDIWGPLDAEHQMVKAWFANFKPLS